MTLALGCMVIGMFLIIPIAMVALYLEDKRSKHEIQGEK